MRQYIKIPEDCREEIREMYRDGLTIKNIARYIGISVSAAQWVVDPKRQREAQQRYYRKVMADPIKRANRNKSYSVYLKQWKENNKDRVRAYQKKYYLKKRGVK